MLLYDTRVRRPLLYAGELYAVTIEFDIRKRHGIRDWPLFQYIDAERREM